MLNIGIYYTQETHEKMVDFFKHHLLRHIELNKSIPLNKHCYKVECFLGMVNFYLIDISWAMTATQKLSIDHAIINEEINANRIMQKYIMDNTIGRYETMEEILDVRKVRQSNEPTKIS